MTTDAEEARAPRDVDVLLHMDTFQGMSDEEIELVIAAEKSRSLQQGRSEVSEQLYKDMETRLAEQASAAAARAEAAFNAAFESTVRWETV